MSFRKSPNILVTGTPGVGKSTLCKQIANLCTLQWIDVSQRAKDEECLEEYDEVYQCPVLDDDKLIDALEEDMTKGGNIVDYHGCNFFPQRWFDIVFVVRADNTILYDRLKARGYNDKKLEDNVQCEIFQIILEEAQSSYEPDIVHELNGNTEQDLKDNVNRIQSWLKQWKKDNSAE